MLRDGELHRQAAAADLALGCEGADRRRAGRERDREHLFHDVAAERLQRGGRFVAGVTGEQYALPEAVSLMRAVRRRGSLGPLTVSAADPLNFEGVLTPGDRVAPATRRRVTVA